MGVSANKPTIAALCYCVNFGIVNVVLIGEPTVPGPAGFTEEKTAVGSSNAVGFARFDEFDDLPSVSYCSIPRRESLLHSLLPA